MRPGGRRDILEGGACTHELAGQGRQPGLHDRVSLRGVVTKHKALAAIAASDLWVLSNRSDGFGIVVKEVLVHRVPACGVHDLLDRSERVEVVSIGCGGSLARTSRIALRRPKCRQRPRIAYWAECRSGRATAGYLFHSLDHVYGGRRSALSWAMYSVSLPLVR